MLPRRSRFLVELISNSFDLGARSWLRQLQPGPARLGVPPVFVSQFVQTDVRVYRDNRTTHVVPWEHPRPVTQRLRAAERLAVAARLLAAPDADASPRVRARTLN